MTDHVADCLWLVVIIKSNLVFSYHQVALRLLIVVVVLLDDHLLNLFLDLT